MTEFAQVADGIFVLRYPVLDVNVTLVVGDGAALVVDTLSTQAQANELIEAVRRVTPQPWTVVNTHHHFDHCFGNAALAAAAGSGAAGSGGCAIWGHENAARRLREQGRSLQRELYDEYAASTPELADGLAAVTVLPPDHTVHSEAILDVGGRTVALRHFGRGHTDGDLVVHVPDADLVIAGDLVEESGPLSFGDAYPIEWAETLAALLALTGPRTVVVPGHGAVVDREFTAAQHAELTELEWLIREGHSSDALPERMATTAPFGPDASVIAMRRGYAELSDSR